MIERRVGGRWKLVTGPPRHADPGDFGQWYRVWRSQDGKWLLGEWTHPCDSAHAFFIPPRGGRPQVVTGEFDWRKGPVTYPLGWTAAGLARVRVLTGGDCAGGPFSRPGIYLIDPKTGHGTFVRKLTLAEGGGSRR